MNNFYTPPNLGMSIENSREKLAQKLGTFSTDILKIGARKITDSLGSDIVFVTQDTKLQQMWDSINKSQDMLSYFKEIETNAFLYGSQKIVGEPLKVNGKWMIWFDKFLPTRPAGTAMLGSVRTLEYLGWGGRQIANPNGGMSSTLSVLQLGTKQDMLSYQMGVNTFGNYAFNNLFVTETPQYIKTLALNGAIKKRHKMGVLPVADIYNRAEFQLNSSQMSSFGDSYNTEFNQMKDCYIRESENKALTDGAPIENGLDIVDYLGVFLGYENLTNHTRIVGQFSASELNSFSTQLGESSAISPALKAILQNVFVKTTPTAGSESKVYTSEFKGVEIMAYAKELIAFLEQQCNFGDANSNEISNYETESKTKQRDNRYASFIRQRNRLRTSQFKMLVFDRIVTGLLGEEYCDKYSIRIVSNILQDDLDSLDTLKQHAELGTLDQESLIESANKNKSPQEIETIKTRLKTQAEQQKQSERDDAQFSVNLENSGDNSNEV